MSAAEPLPKRVYGLLSDGRFHSGTQLATECRVSRNAIWKAIAALRLLGVTVHAVPNRGYRLPAATALLERERIVRLLPRAVGARLRTGQCAWRTGSTNTDLLQLEAAAGRAVRFPDSGIPDRWPRPASPELGRPARRRHLPVAELVLRLAAARHQRAQSRHRRVRTASSGAGGRHRAGAQMAQ